MVSFACRQNWYLNAGVTASSIEMSAPAQKNFSPWPAITITSTASSKRARRMHASMSSIISWL